jgi:hypothetical protein
VSLFLETGSWLLRESWSGASPQERTICQKTKLLSDSPKEGFVAQIHVTVSVALLIDWAAATNILAVQVLHLLLTGCVGGQVALTQVRSRLAKIKKGLAKLSICSSSTFSPLSLRQRLDSAFYLPIGTSYPDIRTHSQQAKAEGSNPLGKGTCQAFALPFVNTSDI